MFWNWLLIIFLNILLFDECKMRKSAGLQLTGYFFGINSRHTHDVNLEDMLHNKFNLKGNYFAGLHESPKAYSSRPRVQFQKYFGGSAKSPTSTMRTTVTRKIFNGDGKFDWDARPPKGIIKEISTIMTTLPEIPNDLINMSDYTSTLVTTSVFLDLIKQNTTNGSHFLNGTTTEFFNGENNYNDSNKQIIAQMSYNETLASCNNTLPMMPNEPTIAHVTELDTINSTIMVTGKIDLRRLTTSTFKPSLEQTHPLATDYSKIETIGANKSFTEKSLKYSAFTSTEEITELSTTTSREGSNFTVNQINPVVVDTETISTPVLNEENVTKSEILLDQTETTTITTDLSSLKQYQFNKTIHTDNLTTPNDVETTVSILINSTNSRLFEQANMVTTQMPTQRPEQRNKNTQVLTGRLNVHSSSTEQSTEVLIWPLNEKLNIRENAMTTRVSNDTKVLTTHIPVETSTKLNETTQIQPAFVYSTPDDTYEPDDLIDLVASEVDGKRVNIPVELRILQGKAEQMLTNITQLPLNRNVDQFPMGLTTKEFSHASRLVNIIDNVTIPDSQFQSPKNTKLTSNDTHANLIQFNNITEKNQLQSERLNSKALKVIGIHDKRDNQSTQGPENEKSGYDEYYVE